MQGMPRSPQTSGICGRSRRLVGFSPVITLQPSTLANAMTKGSAPDRFFRVSMSFLWSLRISITASCIHSTHPFIRLVAIYNSMKCCLLMRPLLHAHCSFSQISVLRAFPSYSTTSLFTKKYIASPTRRAVFTRFFVKKSS